MKTVIEIKQQMIENSENIMEFLKNNNLRFIVKEVETGVCPNCGKEFIKRGMGTSNEKNYCSFLCRSRCYAKIYADFNREFSEEYRNKKKAYFDKWRKENREHFNDLLREPNRIRAKKEYDEWNEKGLCTSCGKERDNPNLKSCIRCRGRWKK
jgi:hypothetical protein